MLLFCVPFCSWNPPTLTAAKGLLFAGDAAAHKSILRGSGDGWYLSSI